MRACKFLTKRETLERGREGRRKLEGKGEQDKQRHHASSDEDEDDWGGDGGWRRGWFTCIAMSVRTVWTCASSARVCVSVISACELRPFRSDNSLALSLSRSLASSTTDVQGDDGDTDRLKQEERR